MSGKTPWHIPLSVAAQDAPNLAAGLFSHGSALIEYYAPRGEDLQTPHDRDEIYIITSGAARFTREGEEISCVAGDAIFVPAGMAHRFFDISADFATWVIFYGPVGGEGD